jgi:hypothetical protein
VSGLVHTTQKKATDISCRLDGQLATHPSTMQVETKILVPPQSNSVSYCVPPSSGDWRKKSYLQQGGQQQRRRANSLEQLPHYL